MEVELHEFFMPIKRREEGIVAFFANEYKRDTANLARQGIALNKKLVEVILGEKR